MWHDINNTADAEHLLEVYGGFHDGCIVKSIFSGKCFVDDDTLSMGFSDVATLKVFFQRQYRNPHSIEMEFIGLETLHYDIAKDFIIFDATIQFSNDLIYWADVGGWSIENKDLYPNCTWISAKSLRWRIVS